MKKAYKYNTLRGLFRALGNNGGARPVFTLSDFLSGRAYLNGKFAGFTLSDSLRDDVLQIFAGVIWKRGAAEKAHRLATVENCGILRRVWIVKDGGEYSAEYCAGQDYTAEIRFIQKLMK